MEEYAVLYKTVQVRESLYMMIPERLICGYGLGDEFLSCESYPVYKDISSIKDNQYIIFDYYSFDDLQLLFDEYELDLDFMKDYFLESEKDFIVLVEEVNGVSTRKKISLKELKNGKQFEIYDFSGDVPVVVLNNEIINRILSTDSLADVRKLLMKYQKSIKSFQDREESDYVTRVTVEDGKIMKIDANARIINDNSSVNDCKCPQVGRNIDSKDNLTNVSVAGLEDYINERVLGREKEVHSIATTLIMNYTAMDDEDTETILVLGPSGSGKTATFKAASEYLDIPFRIVDCPTLVPQGIVGPSLDDYLADLLQLSGGDMTKASKSILVFDEFDKLSQKNPDFKEAIINEFLKFTEGTDYLITRKQKSYTIKTFGMSKVFLGVFDYARRTKTSIGFGNEINSRESTYLKNNLADGVNFGKEMIDRVSDHILVYSALSQELKRKILLESKYSVYLKKKKRYLRQFGVEFEMEIEYIDALLEKIEAQGESMREINSMIMQSLDAAQFEMLAHPNSYKKLVLTKDTVDDANKFILA